MITAIIVFIFKDNQNNFNRKFKIYLPPHELCIVYLLEMRNISIKY